MHNESPVPSISILHPLISQMKITPAPRVYYIPILMKITQHRNSIYRTQLFATGHDFSMSFQVGLFCEFVFSATSVHVNIGREMRGTNLCLMSVVWS